MYHVFDAVESSKIRIPYYLLMTTCINFPTANFLTGPRLLYIPGIMISYAVMIVFQNSDIFPYWIILNDMERKITQN